MGEISGMYHGCVSIEVNKYPKLVLEKVVKSEKKWSKIGILVKNAYFFYSF